MTSTWLDKYNVPDYEVPPRGTQGLPPFIAQVQIRTPVLISLRLLAVACAYKWFFALPLDAREGFPSYFTFLVLASFFPAVLLFRSTQRFINWRAVSFTVFWVVLTSLIWEATLASPYGWWGYQAFHMVGLYVGAWFKLPIEAVLLWVSATFTTVDGLRGVQDSHQYETRLRFGLADRDVRATKCGRVGERAASSGTGRLRG